MLSRQSRQSDSPHLKSQLARRGRRKYRKYPKLVQAIENRYINYNESLDLVSKLAKSGDAFVIRPKKPVKISQIEKSVSKLNKLYEDGYNDAKEAYGSILEFMDEN